MDTTRLKEYVNVALRVNKNIAERLEAAGRDAALVLEGLDTAGLEVDFDDTRSGVLLVALYNDAKDVVFEFFGNGCFAYRILGKEAQRVGIYDALPTDLLEHLGVEK